MRLARGLHRGRRHARRIPFLRTTWLMVQHNFTGRLQKHDDNERHASPSGPSLDSKRQSHCHEAQGRPRCHKSGVWASDSPTPMPTPEYATTIKCRDEIAGNLRLLVVRQRRRIFCCDRLRQHPRICGSRVRQDDRGIALRTALGASRVRLIRKALTEKAYCSELAVGVVAKFAGHLRHKFIAARGCKVASAASGG